MPASKVCFPTLCDCLCRLPKQSLEEPKLVSAESLILGGREISVLLLLWLKSLNGPTEVLGFTIMLEVVFALWRELGKNGLTVHTYFASTEADRHDTFSEGLAGCFGIGRGRARQNPRSRLYFAL